ncbi:MAG: hypothetical protein COU35_04470 [Candidatus Magasanikbacteria bacterium CG10_big_fil_rev_8_21_14_0_10_47_10]|uniref:DUF2914 domain-containing protein n=1 Tax=Candidatus Magasanikbacteria bacterium CG10_big_fil_rev_8_21_14_0_10_47_10 TaxID=1974652 RepID=A0A2H0TPK9_9BACT|nr:MAG: hypothetical protein COU35_04470 [Candidatus Magasanikbacteria bacterium CG10_big_fil_rev_8_21_14_0_10_47_10]
MKKRNNVKEKIKRLTRYNEIKAFLIKYERVLMPATLVTGVLFDTVTFRTINIVTSSILLGVYLVIAGGIIAYMNAYDAHGIERGKVLRYVRLISPFVIQFAFGALLSASLIFYWFSGALSASWPILLLLALLMVSNDVFRQYYLRPGVQVSVYYFIIFSLCSLILPYVFNSISVWVFIAAGILSLGVMAGFLWLLSRAHTHMAAWRKKYAVHILIIFAFMNGLYFLNIIPPIPLSLREAGVYHKVERVGGDYVLTGEDETLLQRLTPGETIHVAPGEPVYVYTAIFAPAELKTRIVHHWERYDEATSEWQDRDRLSFAIFGGRDEGYRGYSFKRDVPPGKWRVSVETQRGQSLGRVVFVVEGEE